MYGMLGVTYIFLHDSTGEKKHAFMNRAGRKDNNNIYLLNEIRNTDDDATMTEPSIAHTHAPPLGAQQRPPPPIAPSQPFNKHTKKHPFCLPARRSQINQSTQVRVFSHVHKKSSSIFLFFFVHHAPRPPTAKGS